MNDKKSEIYSAIAVAALLIGTATGSAIIMLVLSAVALSVGGVFFRPHGGPAVRVMIVAAVTAIIVALLVALRAGEFGGEFPAVIVAAVGAIIVALVTGYVLRRGKGAW